MPLSIPVIHLLLWICATSTMLLTGVSKTKLARSALYCNQATDPPMSFGNNGLLPKSTIETAVSALICTVGVAVALGLTGVKDTNSPSVNEVTAGLKVTT